MRRAAGTALAILCVLGIPAQALAKDWVTLDYRVGVGGHWLDRDSLRRAGDVVYFESSPYLRRGQYPDDSTPGTPRAYDCGTATMFHVREGRLVDGDRKSGAEAQAYSYVFCRSTTR